VSFLSVAATLAGCVTASPNAGSGPIQLSPKATKAFEEYKNGTGLSSPLVFAIAEDSSAWAWFYGGAGHGTGREHEYQAIQFCQTRTRPDVMCKIFAHGQHVVWNGPVCFTKLRTTK